MRALRAAARRRPGYLPTLTLRAGGQFATALPSRTLEETPLTMLPESVDAAGSPSDTEAAAAPREDRFESEFLLVLSRVHAALERFVCSRVYMRVERRRRFRNEIRVAEKDRRNAIKLEWQQVAHVLDRFLSIVFALITISSLLVIVTQREVGSFLSSL